MLPHSTGSATELKDIAATVWRWKWVIVALTAAAAGAAFFLAERGTERWEATALVLVRGPETADVVGQDSSSPQEAKRDLANELAFIRGDEVRSAIVERLGGPARVTAQTQGDGDVIGFRAEGTNPARVAEMANVAADVYVELRAARVINDYVDTAAIVQQQIDGVIAEQEALVGPVETFRETIDPNAVDEFGVPVNSETEISTYLAELARLEAAIDVDLTRLDATETVLRRTLGELEIGSQLLGDGAATVIIRARVPTAPFEPDVTESTLIGLVAGLVLGLAAAFMLEYLDTSVRSRSDVERASRLRVIAVIPRVRRWRKRTPHDVADLPKQAPSAAESYRSAWTSLEFLRDPGPMSKILVTSPLSSEGKTTTACNLSVVIAKAGRQVALVDCDLRRPQVHAVFGLDNDVGLTSIISGDTQLADALQAVTDVPNLRVLTSGPLLAEPTGYLATPGVTSLLSELEKEYDFIIIDSPPVLPVSDPSILARQSDGVIVVARAGKTQTSDLEETIRILNESDARILGVVLNVAKPRSVNSYGYSSIE